MLPLTTDTVTVRRSATVEDAHGFVTASPESDVWTGRASIQRQVGVFDSSQAGPYDPAKVLDRARMFTQPDADVQPGDVVVAGSVRWLVEHVLPWTDPRGGGGLDHLDCMLLIDPVTVTE